MYPLEDENPGPFQKLLEPFFEKIGDELFQTPKE